MKTQKQGIIIRAIVSLAGEANPQAQLVRTLKHYVRKSIPGTVALATLGLFSTVAPAATVDAIFNGPTDVPVTADSYTATGNTVNFTLNFTPATGTELMVVNNTGLGFINGTFDNLTNGQPVALSYDGTIYNFVANYYGRGGNDLVLVWANNRAFAWGLNSQNQLGDNTTTNRLLPVPVKATGVLAGKTLVAIAAGMYHSLALCSDGTVVAWGYNNYGQLGDNTTVQRSVPVAVNTVAGVSALYGKRVVAIAAGKYHSLALCSDSTVAAWGYNNYGQLGDNTTTQRNAPVAVNTDSSVSALNGKTAVGIAVGVNHSLALCSDGTVAAWGLNSYGQLGDSTSTTRKAPVAVKTDSGVSALYGKTVVGLGAGNSHSVALCSDGTLAAWGSDVQGQLGDNSAGTLRFMPVAVNTNSGISALFGKNVVGIAVSGMHNVALCSDNTVAAWGLNGVGQLGDNTATDRYVPVTVNTNSGVSALYSKTVVGLGVGANHSVALCSNGTLITWGEDSYGELGDNGASGAQSLVPVAVNATPLAASLRFTRVSSSNIALHTLALVAGPSPTQIILNVAQTLPNGSFKFTFTNTPGAFFGVLASTNPALPLSDWTPLGDATEVSPGQFQFMDPQATNGPQRFYRVRSP